MAQTLASWAYQAVNRVYLGRGKRVRFRSKGRGLDSVEGKRNDVGLRFIAVRSVDYSGRWIGNEGQRIQTTMTSRAGSKKGKKRLTWKESKRYQGTQRQLRNVERQLAAHRKSLHGHLAHSIVKLGTTITVEKTSFKGWQKLYGKSIGLRAPGLFLAHLARLVARTGGTLTSISTFKTRLSHYCHQCDRYEKKPLSQRWHHCPCGVGPVQCDLYSAFLLAYLEPEKTIPSITHSVWEGAEPRLRVVVEGLQQRANEEHLLNSKHGPTGSTGRPCQSASARKFSLSSTRAAPSFFFLGRGRERKR